ncbi:MAG: glycine oxidase ThiO [Mariprofundaceae bacterium]|nr:glycine oxidase ThiO [Mariprofundaceae bacterium]
MAMKPARVAIIGGGIIGSLTAWRLKQQGIEPVLIERGRLGRESSWAGAGILCPIQPWLYPDAFTRLIDASLAMYPDLQDELIGRTGISPEWLKSGLMVPFFPDDEINHRQAALDWSRRFNWQVEDLSAAQARKHEPLLAEDASGALLWPEVAQARNPRLLRAVHAMLEQEKIEVLKDAEVTALLQAAGRVSGVGLADGRQIHTDAVLLAAGSWSGGLGRQLGFELPVKPVKGQIVLLKSEPGRLRHIVKHDRAYFVPRADGRILVGASMEMVGFKPGNTVAEVQSLLDGLTRLLPGLADAPIEHQWAGFRPGTPDGLPFLGPVHACPGLWVASGHYRNGVALAPITAHIISRWMSGEPPELDMSCFLPERTVINSESVGFPAAA